jgi:single-strand DNA-binding protein
MTMNKMLVIGNLGGDPEMRYTPSGQAVTSFSIATNYRYTTADGESREETEWFRISVWGRQAESCNQYLSKGRKVYVEGRLKSRTYETRDGQTRFQNEINATDVRFIDTSASRMDESRPEGEPPRGEADMGADDLPF